MNNMCQLWHYPNRFVAIYLIARFVIWTVVIWLTQPTLPLDVLEHLAWGKEWRLVYSSHPGLPAWINEAVHITFSGNHLALSAISPFFSCVAIWAVWQLARDTLKNNNTAAIAALSLEGVFYFNISAIEFNHNVAQLTAITLFFLTVWRAFSLGKYWWPVAGMIAAFAMWAKYSSLLVLVSIFLWSLWDRQARGFYRSWGPYAAMAVFTILILPNIWALTATDFQPVEFAFNRAKKSTAWWQSAVFPLHFMLAQVMASILAVALCRLATGRWLPRWSTATPTFSNRFIIVAAFSPLLLAMLISAVGGLRFKSTWGAAMCSLWPLLILMWHGDGKLNIRFWRRGFIIISALTVIIHTAIFIGGPYLTGKAKRVHYPAAQIASHIDREWAQQFPEQPLSYVIGKKHTASMVSYYSQWRPSAVIDGDLKKSFWVKADDIHQSGAVIVWVVDNGKGRQNQPFVFSQSTPLLQRQPNFKVDWLSGANLPALEMGWAILPPR